MFEATGWKLEEPEVADQQKYDLIVPTIVKSPKANDHHDDGVSKTALSLWRFATVDSHIPVRHCLPVCMSQIKT
jgi:hypothetical protein